LFVNGQIEGYKLAGFEIEFFKFGNLYPIAPGLIGFFFNPDHPSCAPWFKGHVENFRENRDFTQRRKDLQKKRSQGASLRS